MMKEEKKETVNEAETTSVANNQPVVNTEAIKVKANELLDKAKSSINYYKANIKTDKRLIIGTVGVVAIVVLLILLLCVNPSKSVVKTYAEAMLDYDAKQIVSITHEDMIDYFEDLTDKDYKDMLKDSFEMLKDAGYKYKEYEIDNDYKKYDKDDVEDISEEWDDDYGIDEKSVKAVRRYTVKFKVSVDGERDTKKVKILVAKIDGKWYYMGEE